MDLSYCPAVDVTNEAHREPRDRIDADAMAAYRRRRSLACPPKKVGQSHGEDITLPLRRGICRSCRAAMHLVWKRGMLQSGMSLLRRRYSRSKRWLTSLSGHGGGIIHFCYRVLPSSCPW